MLSHGAEPPWAAGGIERASMDEPQPPQRLSEEAPSARSLPGSQPGTPRSSTAEERRRRFKMSNVF